MHRYLAAGAWLSHKHMVLEIRASPRAEFGRSTSNGTGVIKEIRVKKIDPSRPAFQDHSRSSEPTEIDPPPMPSY